MKKMMLFAAAVPFLALCLTLSADEGSTAAKPDDPDLAADLKLIQGTWELQHGNDAKGMPKIRSVKTIKGNQETLRRFNVETGQQVHEHSVEIKLSKSGAVRVCTFYPVGGNPKDGYSFVYKVDKQNYYDIPGILQDSTYQNYQSKPRVWHWKRIADEKPDSE